MTEIQFEKFLAVSFFILSVIHWLRLQYWKGKAEMWQSLYREALVSIRDLSHNINKQNP